MKSLFASVFVLAAVAGSSVAVAQTPNQAAAPGEIVYLPQLPTAESLTGQAQAQGMSIASIRQTDGQELVTYHFNNGPDSVVAYRVLPAGSGVAPTSQPAPTGTTVVTPTTPAPAVVYATTTTAVPAYYYSDYYYGYPYYPYYGGWGIGLGWYGGGWGGYRGGWGGGGFRGGWGGGFHGGGRR